MKLNAFHGLLLTLGLCAAVSAADNKSNMNQPAFAAPNQSQFLTLGGGCFWCVEAVFEMVDGVKSVISGYAGGLTENPTYKQICMGNTGHAEVVQIEFDASKVSVERLLEIFWESHDPTSLNRQGADVGTQYRSAIFYTDEAQRAAALKSKALAQKLFTRPIVTEIAPLKKFYEAELYHQDYFRNNPNQGYCSMVIAPKVAKMKQKLAPKK